MPHKPIELSANLLQGWQAERELATRQRRSSTMITVVLVIAGIATVTPAMIWSGSAQTKLANAQYAASKLKRAQKAAAIDAFAPTIESYKNQNDLVLLQLGHTLAQTRSTVTLDNLEAEVTDTKLTIRGSGAAENVGIANAFTARLTANNPGAKAYLTGVDRQPSDQSIKLNFELVLVGGKNETP
jgi:Tfp pilus assembly protein PilF